MGSYQVEPIFPCVELGKGPHWDATSQSLYFVSVSDALLLRFDYKSNKVYQATADGTRWASFIVPVKGCRHQFVIGDGNQLLLIEWDGVSSRARTVKELANVGDGEQHNRFHDGKADPEGRLYAGTMLMEHLGNSLEKDTAVFYRYDAKAGQLVPLKRNVYVSNGLEWNTRTKKFYYIDTGVNDIKEYDIDGAGNLKNEQLWHDFKVNGESPGFLADSMTMDNEGNLYVAAFGGSKVLKLSPDKRVVQEIKIPARQVIAVAFGGPNLDELFVTTGAKDILGPQPSPGGALFKVTGLGAKGLLPSPVQLYD